MLADGRIQNEVVIVGICRAESGHNGGQTRVSNGAGRQTLNNISVVGAVQLVIIGSQILLAAVGIDNGGVGV